MSSITDRIESLSDTRAAADELKRAAEADPGDESLLLNIQSLENRERDIEDEFAVHAEANWIDVVDYRLFKAGDGNPVIKALASALTTFQNAFTVVYDALTTRPKLRALSNPAAVAATSFQFGYAYEGSVGFVLTLPNERVLFDSDLDRAMEKLFLMAKSESSDQVATFAKEVGPAGVNALYRWAETLVENGMGADLGWQKGSQELSRVTLDVGALQNLLQAISETSDQEETTITVDGTLLGDDTNREGGRSFHFRVDAETEMRGRMAPDVGVVETPQFYRARIRVRRSVNYATDVASEEYFLLSLERLDNRRGQSAP
jgi:hypothetical protein